jgi:hypothetical protein
MIGALAILNFSCNKSPESIGDNLQPESNFIGVYYIDSIEVQSYSVLVDSLSTKNVTYALLGSMKDPVFGQTDAGFYTQFHLSSSTHNFGDAPVFDSLVLQLYQSGYYGDTTTMQTIHVYELEDTLSSQESYYGFTNMPVGVTDYANSYQYYPRPLTSGRIVGTDTIAKPVIRIPLSQELGQKLLSFPSSAYESSEAFKAEFKGLYVTSESVNQNGSISSIALTNNTYSLLQLYYRENPSSEKTLRYDFYVTSSDVYFTHYEHDYETGSDDFRQQVLQGDTALGADVLYLQAMGGVKTFLKFPEVETWVDSLGKRVVINEAKLIISGSASVGDSSYYPAPSKLVVVGIRADGTNFLLPDYYEGDSYYGGAYSSKTNTVTFRISEYLQDIVSGVTPNLGVYLAINAASYNAQRWVIAGPSSTEGNRLKLELTYSLVGE